MNRSSDEKLKQERQTLRLLCSDLIRPLTRMELCNLLEASLFQDTLHRTAFEEIRAAGTIPAARLREALPGRITNRGFPDSELLELLGEDTAMQSGIEDLFMSVLCMIQARHKDNDSKLSN